MVTTEDTESTEGKRDPFTEKVIGCAIEVHRQIRGTQLLIPPELKIVSPEFVSPEFAARICNDRLILELKAVEKVKDIHKAQLLTYMKLAKIKTGLLINFNVRKLVNGIQRFKV